MGEFLTILAVLWCIWLWREPIQKWLLSFPLARTVKGKIDASQIPEEAYYVQAAHEIKNRQISEGLWTKAWSEAGGDNNRAQALYIKLRVEAMKSEAARRFSGVPQQPSPEEKTIVPCTKCGISLRVPIGKLLDVRCTSCGHEFRVDTAHGNQVEEYPSLKNQMVGRIGRLSFLWLWLAAAFATFVLGVVIDEGGLDVPTISPINFTTWVIIALVAFNLLILVARLHDVNYSGWFALLGLVPFVYLAMLLFLFVAPGSPGRNRFGPVDIGMFNEEYQG